MLYFKSLSLSLSLSLSPPPQKKGFKTPSQGSGTTLWCATSPDLEGMGGVYCENCDIASLQEEGPAARFSGVAELLVDTDEASKLWKRTEEILESIT